MSERDLVKEIWAHRDDPDEWGEEVEDIRIAPNPSHVVSFRLSSEELNELERIMEAEGRSLSDVIRTRLALAEERSKRERIVRFGRLLAQPTPTQTKPSD